MKTREEQRLAEARERKVHWKRWGPDLSERAWGTVREDYSGGGTAWEYLPLYDYLDASPTHSYLRMLYKYPQAEYPYAELVAEDRRRGRAAREYELVDSGVLEGNRYYDVFVEYAKASPEDILVRVEVAHRGPDRAELDLLPTLWFRNTWSWTREARRPSIRPLRPAPGGGAAVVTPHPTEGSLLGCEGSPELLFTENDTNLDRLYGLPRARPLLRVLPLRRRLRRRRQPPDRVDRARGQAPAPRRG